MLFLLCVCLRRYSGFISCLLLFSSKDDVDEEAEEDTEEEEEDVEAKEVEESMVGYSELGISLLIFVLMAKLASCLAYK